MGGINHQPCNKPNTSYLKFSTRMSRALSVAKSELELANINLEDVLLAELDGATGGSISKISLHLQRSSLALSQMQSEISSLRKDMQNNKFQDLPSLHTANLEVLGRDFDALGIIDKTAWDFVSKTMRHDGFYGMLAFFERETNQLDTHTIHLIEAISSSEDIVAEGTLNLVLEKNRPGNFKVEFARLYSAWLEFQQVFLASSMLSTELWYRYQGVGSLRNKSRSARVA